jgi:hypothetical protein
MSSKLWLAFALLAIILAVAVSLPHSEPAAPPKTYALKSLIKEGDKELIIYKLEANALISTPGLPKHPVMPMYSKLQQEIEQKMLKMDGGEIVRLERHYRASKYYISKSSQTPKAESLDGKKIIIESDGTITPVGQASIDKIIDQARPFISVSEHQFALILPAEEIPLKAEWEIPAETVARVFNFSSQKKRAVTHGCTEVGINARFSGGSLKCLLKEIKADTAVIELKGELKGEDNGLKIEAALKGAAWFAIKKGRFTKLELAGDIALDGSQPCIQVSAQGQVVGKGKITIAYEFK